MKLKTLFYASLIFTGVSTGLFAADIWRAPTEDAPDGDWTDGTTWASGNVPTSSDTAKIDKLESNTYSNSDVSVGRLDLFTGNVIVSGGTFSTSVSMVRAGTLTISGTANFQTTSAFNSGDGQDHRYISENKTVINVYDDAKVTDKNWGVLIGEEANTIDSVANFYGNSVITTGNNNGVKIGNSRTWAESATAKSTLNVFENSTVNASTLYLYKNAELNVYGDAIFNASNKAYLGDTKTNTVAKVNLKGNSVMNLKSYSFISNAAIVTVSENATLNFTQDLFVGTADNRSSTNTTSGHLILKDTAKLNAPSCTLIMYGNDSTIELHGSNIKPADGQSYMVNRLGITEQADSIGTGGTIKFVADQNGISTFKAGWIEYNNSTAQTGYALELDFTNFAPADGEGTYSFNVISSVNNWNGREASIMQNYFTEAEIGNEDLVKIIKANDADSYEFFIADGGRTFGITYNYVPEPSTYAAIFGAIALAFAAYRRRK
ncbi:PEP-CTERM sorting domain-containing protein [Intestinicryptomonas porci]|uniref:PEP-CTERM sorting domain-containing protein n=1 Tax=Intestinicryptomonas porci TaxID=2926320 RepID=A0ABU4WFY4_9BACT|nr:PEP-CTERM sorting domain-containing protein [Opitutales bacterium CLA-KB-P66]